MINSFQGEYRFLSNFHPCTIVYEEITYPSVEHAYQAAKTNNLSHRHCIAATSSPGLAKRLGRRVPIRPDWEQKKLQIMYQLCRQKFFKNETLAQQLKTTGDQPLIKGNAWNDTFWGICNGRGQNHLGKILMIIRQQLNDNESTEKEELN